MKRMTDAIKKIAIHTALAYVAMLLGLGVSAVITLIIPGAGETSTIIGRTLDSPFWLAEVGCGVVVGWWMRSRFSIGLSGLVIIIPTLFLGLDILFEGLPMRTYTPLVDIYFSSDNGATEGVYKLMFVAPLYTAIGYCVGAIASKLFKTGPHETEPKYWTS
jgi:hypothetical protein